MRAKKTVCFFSLLLLFSIFTCSVDATSDVTTSFSGNGITIDVTYPTEAQPDTNITHYITITSSTTATLKNFTVVIKALVSSSWQEILNGMNVYGIPPQLPQNYNLTLPLPQDANGMLQCFIFVNTSRIDDLYTTIYTTLVSDPSFSEMRALYDEMLTNYTSLQAEYETLLDDYDSLLANYSSLFADYTTLLNEHNQLTSDYNSKVSDYESLLAQYNKLSDDYNDLDADYRSKITELGELETSYYDLNVTRYDLQTSYNTLDTIYKGLNETYTDLQTAFVDLQDSLDVKQAELDIERVAMFIIVVAVAVLIAFIVYIKKKQEDPYLVIRKETVSMKSDEET